MKRINMLFIQSNWRLVSIFSSYPFIHLLTETDEPPAY